MLIIKHTVETTASPEAIWEIWQDVANWNTWDHDIEFSAIDGPFKAGTTGNLKPKGGPVVTLSLRVSSLRNSLLMKRNFPSLVLLSLIS